MTRPIRTATHAATMLALASSMALAANDESNVCDGGYSMTDVNNDGYISPIEANTYAKRQSTDMDADQSGTVSRDEYVNCAMKNRTVPAMEEKGALVAWGVVDVDNDGSVSSDEYIQHTTDLAEKAKGGDTAAEEQASTMFYMSPDEERIDFTTVTAEELANRGARMFSARDSDQDYSLTREEFIAATLPQVDISEVLNREFDDADADRSGDLTQTELIAANAKWAEDAMTRAQEATGEEMNPDVGPPVVYYIYPHPM